MNTPTGSGTRLAAIAYLVKKMSPRPGIGRTGIMKLIYLLQETKEFYLGYDFRLYTYGPYDAQVLEDLKVAEIRNAVKSEEYDFQYGRGYLITAGDQADRTIAAGNLPQALETAIDQLVSEFGSRTAADLEMIGTIIFADRAASSGHKKAAIEELARSVHNIKPYIAPARIEAEAKALKEKDLLESAL